MITDSILVNIVKTFERDFKMGKRTYVKFDDNMSFDRFRKDFVDDYHKYKDTEWLLVTYADIEEIVVETIKETRHWRFELSDRTIYKINLMTQYEDVELLI
jgi:hypothetical protein